MLKITAENPMDGNTYTYNVISWNTFKRWRNYFAYGFVLLAIGTAFGVWGESYRSKQELKNEINTYATQSCLATRHFGSIYDKYNDLVGGIIETRNDSYQKNIIAGNMAAAKVDQNAIARYQKDFIDVPTKAQCERKILK